MTIEEYNGKIEKIMEAYRKEVASLQDRYELEYDKFKAGDLCRETRGFKCYFVIKKVRHVRNQGEIYTLLDGVTTTKNGEEHYGSRKDAFRDTETQLVRPA